MQNKNRLGCLTGTGILALLITTFVIAGYAYAQGGMLYNPGPLSTKQSGEALGGVISHAEISGDCKACHTAPWESATMADRCTVCHTTVAVQMKNVASLHGKLMHDNPNLGCRHCHSEHRGADAALTVMADTIFPHEAVGYSLNGHQRTAAGKPFTVMIAIKETSRPSRRTPAKPATAKWIFPTPKPMSSHSAATASPVTMALIVMGRISAMNVSRSSSLVNMLM